MNLSDVQTVFERTEPIINKSNSRLWVTISILAIIAVVVIVAVNQNERKEFKLQEEES